MMTKYSSHNWEINWLDLCDGKAVFGKIMVEISSDIGVRVDVLKENIISQFTLMQEGALNDLKEKIIALFG